MTTKQDKIAKEFYKKSYNKLSDEQKYDVKSAIKDMRSSKENSVGMRFSTEKALINYMNGKDASGTMEKCIFCGKLKRIGKPCNCQFGGVFG